MPASPACQNSISYYAGPGLVPWALVRELSAFKPLKSKIKHRFKLAFNGFMRRFRLFAYIDKRFIKWGLRVRL